MTVPRVMNVSLAVRVLFEDGVQAAVATVPQQPPVDMLDTVPNIAVSEMVAAHYDTVLEQIKHDGLEGVYARAVNEAAARREQVNQLAAGARAAHALTEESMKTVAEVLLGLGNLVEAHITRAADSPFVESRSSGQGLQVVVRDKEGVSRTFLIAATEVKDGPELGCQSQSQEAAGPAGEQAGCGRCPTGEPGTKGEHGNSDAATKAGPVQDECQAAEPAGAK